jgi:prepilin-type N-terminal cleavage/methylation domain-containing protein
MKTSLTNIATRIPRRAFTLVELLVATAVGSVLGGAVLLLLCQTAAEQRSGLADITVEEKAYIFQADITACLRSMSANQGMTPDYSSGLYDTNGNLLGYRSVFIFYPTNGTYITANISYNSSSGQVAYTTNILDSSTQMVWMSNSATAALTQFCLSASFNLDGSQNNSLVNVLFQMNDNGFSGQNPVNNPTSIYRNFSVQMRNDN